MVRRVLLLRPRAPSRTISRTLLVIALLAGACAGDDGDSVASEGSTSDPATATSEASATTSASTTDASGSSGSTAATGTSAATDTAGTTAATTSTTTTSGDETTTTTTGGVSDVPGGVFLWTGAGGGGPGTDLYLGDVESLLDGAGVTVAVGDALPGDFVDAYGTLVYMNPTGDFPAEIDAAALELVDRGGRLVLIMEHCKNGCWGNADGHNALLEALGAGMRVAGDGGAPLTSTPLSVAAWPPLTDGVSSIVVFYSGHVIPGAATIELGRISGGDLVIGGESIGDGEVVAITDSSMFGYVMGEGDNEALIKNFARH